MAKGQLWLDRFDANKTFTVRVPMRLSGRDLKAGHLFDKTLVSVRRLRQLYEQRKIVSS